MLKPGRSLPILTFLLAVGLLLYYRMRPLAPYVVIGDRTIYTEIALTPEQQSRGLSYRDRLADDRGMLFVFKDKGVRPFWMHEMHFPLDIIWIDGSTVADISERVPVRTNGAWTTVAPKAEIDRVLEVNAGTVRRLGIKIGDPVRYNRGL